jgi:hypothetical protein
MDPKEQVVVLIAITIPSTLIIVFLINPSLNSWMKVLPSFRNEGVLRPIWPISNHTPILTPKLIG